MFTKNHQLNVLLSKFEMKSYFRCVTYSVVVWSNIWKEVDGSKIIKKQYKYWFAAIIASNQVVPSNCELIEWEKTVLQWLHLASASFSLLYWSQQPLSSTSTLTVSLFICLSTDHQLASENFRPVNGSFFSEWEAQLVFNLWGGMDQWLPLNERAKLQKPQ